MTESQGDYKETSLFRKTKGNADSWNPMDEVLAEIERPVFESTDRMSILDRSLNQDDEHSDANLVLESGNLLRKTNTLRSNLNSHESRDFMFNLDNILKLRGRDLGERVREWREMGIYSVARELHERFEEVRKYEKELDSMMAFQNSKEVRRIEPGPDLLKMFAPFETLVEREQRQMFVRSNTGKKGSSKKNNKLPKKAEEGICHSIIWNKLSSILK